jgi:hypothetical protein
MNEQFEELKKDLLAAEEPYEPTKDGHGVQLVLGGITMVVTMQPGDDQAEISIAAGGRFLHPEDVATVHTQYDGIRQWLTDRQLMPEDDAGVFIAQPTPGERLPQ